MNYLVTVPLKSTFVNSIYESYSGIPPHITITKMNSLNISNASKIISEYPSFWLRFCNLEIKSLSKGHYLYLNVGEGTGNLHELKEKLESTLDFGEEYQHKIEFHSTLKYSSSKSDLISFIQRIDHSFLFQPIKVQNISLIDSSKNNLNQFSIPLLV